MFDSEGAPDENAEPRPLGTLKLFQESGFIPDYNEMILEVREFFNLRPSAKTETGWLFVPGLKKPIPLKSGYEGGPWAGTQRELNDCKAILPATIRQRLED